MKNTFTAQVTDSKGEKNDPVSGDTILIMAKQEKGIDIRLAGSDLDASILDQYSRSFMSMIVSITGDPRLAFSVGISGLIQGILHEAADLEDPDMKMKALTLTAKLAEAMQPVMAEISEDLNESIAKKEAGLQ